MLGMTVTFVLITFLLSLCCQLLFSYLTTLNMSPFSAWAYVSHHAPSDRPLHPVGLSRRVLLLVFLASAELCEEIWLLQSERLQVHHEGRERGYKPEIHGGRCRLPGASEAGVSREHAGQHRGPAVLQPLSALLTARGPDGSRLHQHRCGHHCQVETSTAPSH